MVNRNRRDCPICGNRDLLKLSNHLSQTHGLSSEERQRWLQRASHHSPPVVVPVEQYPVTTSPNSCLVVSSHNSPVPCLMDNRPPLPVDTLETQPHPEFAFQHPYSMIVVGPSQCGKTHFVHQLLTHKCITYPDKKPVRVCWYYNQWQPRYEEIRRDLGSKIRFFQGVPELEEDLSDIKSSKHTILVLDDLMAEAKDSPVVSKLFTQGRHRNASVILLLQNMFPKGKYNTDISRNATYKVLFRSPGDRKQIDIMAEQTFAKDRPRFMQAYHRETDRPYGYIVVDNHPRTISEQQIVGNVFGDCYTYPHITSTSPLLQPPRETPREQVQQQTRKRQAPAVNMSEVKVSKKRKSTPIQKKVPRVKRQVPVVKTSKKCKVRRVQRPIKKRKEPIYDSTSEEEEEEEAIAGAKTKRELEQNWLRWSEQEEAEDSGDEETEGEDEETPEEQQEPDFRYHHASRGGGGRTVYDDDDDMSPEHVLYNPHLYHRRRSGFGPPRGGEDRPVYDEDTVRYIGRELLKEAFYNPSLVP